MSRKKNREYKDYIEDIYDDLIKARKFTRGLSFEDFMNDVRTQYAVCKALENMGKQVNVFLSLFVGDFLRYRLNKWLDYVMW